MVYCHWKLASAKTLFKGTIIVFQMQNLLPAIKIHFDKPFLQCQNPNAMKKQTKCLRQGLHPFWWLEFIGIKNTRAKFLIKPLKYFTLKFDLNVLLDFFAKYLISKESLEFIMAFMNIYEKSFKRFAICKIIKTKNSCSLPSLYIQYTTSTVRNKDSLK